MEGAAEEDNDYEPIHTEIFFPANEQTALVEIPVEDDFIVEEKESFKLFLFLVDNDESIAVDNGVDDAGTDVCIYDDDSKKPILIIHVLFDDPSDFNKK